MPRRKQPFVNDMFYHIYNRGVEKRTIFLDKHDYNRFLKILYYYQFGSPKPSFSQFKRFKHSLLEENSQLIEFNCYALMPNHFHFCVRQLTNNGIHDSLRKTFDSYTRYFNKKYKRVGPLFQGQFQSKMITSEEQLLHLSRYIHLNPCSAEFVSNPEDYKYSSYKEFINYPESSGLCNPKPLLLFFKDPESYKKFVDDNKDYAKTLKQIEHLTLDD